MNIPKLSYQDQILILVVRIDRKLPSWMGARQLDHADRAGVFVCSLYNDSDVCLNFEVVSCLSKQICTVVM